MKIVRVYNFYFYSLIAGIIISLVFLTIGLINNLPLALIAGTLFLSVSFYYLYRSYGYKLQLQKGLLSEFNNGKIHEIQFKNIEKLDCEIKLGPKTASFHPVFYLETENGILKFKTRQQASVYNLVMWIKENYPKAQLTENVKKIINWSKSGTWLWKSN